MRRPSAFLCVTSLALLAACGADPVTPEKQAPSEPLAARWGNSSNVQACQQGGWRNLLSSTGQPFTSQGDCISHGAQAGTVYQAQTITFDVLADKAMGDADFEVSATASSALPVSFSASGSCSVTGTTVHLIAAGSCTITAHQAGNTTWYPAPDIARAFLIAPGDQIITFTSTAPAQGYPGGATYAPTATATSGLTVAIALDAGSSGCSLSSGVVSFTQAGTCVINANQAGNADWNPAAQVQQSITVSGCVGTEARLRAIALSGGSFNLCPGANIVLTGGEVVVTTTLSLSATGPVAAVIDANQTGRVFVVPFPGNLTLRDVRVSGGRTTGANNGGGMAVLLGGTVVLNGVSSIEGSIAPSGGGVFVDGGNLTLNDVSRVAYNTAARIDASPADGGGVLVVAPGSLTLNGTSRVEGNVVQGNFSYGGGVSNLGGTVALNGASQILGNVARHNGAPFENLGGGVFIAGPQASLTLAPSALITNNTAGAGGGIYLNTASFSPFGVFGVTVGNVFGNAPNNCAGNPVANCVP